LTRLSSAQIDAFHQHGFIRIEGFADADTTRRMLEEARGLAQRKERNQEIFDALILPESALDTSIALADRTSKIFRIHRHEPVFRQFACAPETLETIVDLMGPEVDCFLSQFIFKQPGALGQPWHQDAFYFPFDGPPQIGLWLAVTEARLDNGPLWVLPGSHREPVHNAVRDSRKHANYGYVEIVDHDMSEAVPVLMAQGDLLIFHGHLMHRSTDNESGDLRAAMVYHYATADTVDNSVAVHGRKPANQDWLPVMRNGQPSA